MPILFCHFPQPAHAAVHQIAHRLVVDAHNLADIVVFALLYIIKMYDLLLPGREVADVLRHGERAIRLLLHALHAVFLPAVAKRLHVGVGNLVVAEVCLTAEFVVDAVSERNIEV